MFNSMESKIIYIDIDIAGLPKTLGAGPLSLSDVSKLYLNISPDIPPQTPVLLLNLLKVSL